MNQYNSPFFVGLANLSETLAVAAVDERVRCKDGDAMDSFMAAVLIDQDAFPWFLADEEFTYSRPHAGAHENKIEKSCGFALLLNPVKTSSHQSELTPWQSERLKKAINFGLALPNPTRWMTNVAHHLAQEADDAKSVGLFLAAVASHNNPESAKFAEGHTKATADVLQAAIDQQQERVHERVNLPLVDLAVEAFTLRRNQQLAITWLSGLSPSEFKDCEAYLFDSLFSQDHLDAVRLTFSDSNENPLKMTGVKRLYEWLDERCNPALMADLRVKGLQLILSTVSGDEVAEHLEDLQELMGMHKPEIRNAVKDRLVRGMTERDSILSYSSVDVLEQIVGHNITELFPLIDTHPSLTPHPGSRDRIGKVLDGAFSLADGAAGAKRLRETLDFCLGKGWSMEGLSNGMNALTHLAYSKYTHKPEKLAVLLAMGLDPETVDARGCKPADVLLNKDHDGWCYVVNAFKARKLAHHLVAEIESSALTQPTAG